MKFNDILLNGMARFSNSLSEEDVEAIHQFLIKKQVEGYAKENQ